MCHFVCIYNDRLGGDSNLTTTELAPLERHDLNTSTWILRKRGNAPSGPFCLSVDSKVFTEGEIQGSTEGECVSLLCWKELQYHPGGTHQGR